MELNADLPIYICICEWYSFFLLKFSEQISTAFSDWHRANKGRKISTRSRPVCVLTNEEQIITGYPIDGAMGSSGGGRVRKLLMVCLHNNAIVARGILVTMLDCGTPEPRLSAIYIVSSVGTSFIVAFGLNKKVSCEPLLRGGGQSILKHLYLKDYAEFNSKISYTMFLHDYLLA